MLRIKESDDIIRRTADFRSESDSSESLLQISAIWEPLAIQRPSVCSNLVNLLT